jgi:hypothetical protein
MIAHVGARAEARRTSATGKRRAVPASQTSAAAILTATPRMIPDDRGGDSR